MSGYESEEEESSGITWMEILRLKKFAREHGYYNNRPGPSRVVTAEPFRERGFRIPRRSLAGMMEEASSDSMESSWGPGNHFYMDDILAIEGRDITGPTRSTSAKINLENEDSNRALKLVNGRYPNLRRLTLKEIRGKAKTIVKWIKPENIRALVLKKWEEIWGNNLASY